MTILGIVITALALIIGWSAHYITEKSHNKAAVEVAEDVEEMAEDVIEKESGIKIDFDGDEKIVKDDKQ